MKHLSIFLLIFAFSFSVKAASLLEKADSAYSAEDYKTALSLYNQALEQDGSSSDLQYNIANANYRLGNTGKAILGYERALRLNPANANARVNLDFVNSRIKGLPDDGESFISNLHSNVVRIASPNTWAGIAFVVFLIVIGCAGLYIFTAQPGLRKIGFFGGLVSLVVFVYVFIIAWQTASAMRSHNSGIVITQNARLRANPTTTKSSNEKALAIPEGTKLEIIDSLSTPNDPATSLWYNIELAGNNQAWIDASYVEKI